MDTGGQMVFLGRKVSIKDQGFLNLLWSKVFKVVSLEAVVIAIGVTGKNMLEFKSTQV